MTQLTDTAPDELQSLPVSDVEQKLDSSSEGLSQAEARKRLARYGPKSLRRRGPTRC